MNAENKNAGGNAEKSWYDNKVIVIVLLILFFPVGLYAMWKNKEFSNKTKWIVSGVFGVLVINAMFNEKEKAPTPQARTDTVAPSASTQAAQPQQQAPSKPPQQSTVVQQQPISNISFQEIRRNMETMTDLQFEEYAKTLKGKRIQWGGYVEEVKEKFFGGYEVLVDMDHPNEPLSVQDVSFDVPKEQAMALRKDSPVQFEGTISSALNILTSLQVSLDDARLLR